MPETGKMLEILSWPLWSGDRPVSAVASGGQVSFLFEFAGDP
jgi:hypothetical protein